MATTTWLTSEQAAGRLGVKRETLYAYVSRGLIRSERVPGQRRSRFLRVDVERHAARSRTGGRPGGLEVVIETQLTLLDPEGRLFYRGWDVADAVRDATFEEVAAWLWTGERTRTPFLAPPELAHAANTATAAVSTLPAIDQLRVALAAVRTTDPFRFDRRASAVAATGRAMVAALVEALPEVDPTMARSVAKLGVAPTRAPSIAARLWPRLSPLRATRQRVAALDGALILLADHELAASTLAARVTASTWADPYLVVQAGLAALGGPLHGGASEGARALLREVERGEATAAEAIGARLGRGERIPGFGHKVYRTADPRAGLLLDLVGVPSPAAAAVLATMAERSLPFANVDLALATMAEAFQMVPGAGELIFAVARTVGWLAHAIEEYEHALRFRLRAAYIGPAPAAGPPSA